MKMQPITFKAVYDDTLPRDAIEGFKPFVNKNGEFIKDRFVVAQPRKWNFGYAISFTIYETYWPENRGNQLFQNPFTRELDSTWIYDHQEGDDIKPSGYQIMLIHALGAGETRGFFSEEAVDELYVKLFVLSPKSPMLKFLPRVVDFWKKAYEKNQIPTDY